MRRPSFAVATRRAALGVAAALLLISTVQSAPSNVARSWFDQPLPASQHDLGPMTVTAHATAPGGISEIELLVDGLAAGNQPFAAAPRLATAEFAWQPLEERLYWLVVRGKSGGQWGPPAAIMIQVGEPVSPSPSAGATSSPTPSASATPVPTLTLPPNASPTPSATPRVTPSPTPRVTPSPTPRVTPSPTPCTPAEPAPIAPENNSSPDAPIDDATPTLEWEYFDECQPAGFRIELYFIDQVGDPVEVGNVGPDQRQWTTPPLVNCQQYQWRVFAKKSGGGFGPGSEVFAFYVQYQRTCPTPDPDG